MIRVIAWTAAIATAALCAALAFCLFSDASRIRVPAITALVTFIAVALAYLGGGVAGLALRDEHAAEAKRALVLAASYVPALAGWGILWLPTPGWQVGVAAGVLVLMALGDRALLRAGLMPAWAVTVRAVLAALLCASLILAWALV